ncbi:unnamed protein product [Agarophyton chilense]
MARFSFLLSLFLAASLVIAQENDGSLPDSAAQGVNAVIPNPRPTLYGLIAESERHRILFNLVDSIPEIKTALDEPGARFTVFPPVDQAFVRLARELSPGIQFNESNPAEVIIALGAAIEKIREVPMFVGVVGLVWYHVLEGAFTYGMLAEMGTARTNFNGLNLTFADGAVIDGDDSRGNSSAGPRNIFTLNGWAHQVYGVLLPFNLQAAVDLVVAAPSAAPEVPTAEPTPVPVGSAPSVTAPVAVEETDDGIAAPVEATDDGVAAPVEETDDGQAVAVPVDGGTDTTDESTEGEASVEASPDDDDDVCFPASATVTTVEGESVRMADLQPGQYIHHNEHGASSRVFFFTHRTAKPELTFYRISTASGHAVTMTGKHYLYANGRLTAAHAVQVGQMLRTKAGESAVTSVHRVKETGLYAPHSMHGDLVVDGIVVSSYSRTVEPRLAHALLMPLRWLARATGSNEVLPGMFYEGGRGLERFVPEGQAK